MGFRLIIAKLVNIFAASTGKFSSILYFKSWLITRTIVRQRKISFPYSMMIDIVHTAPLLNRNNILEKFRVI